jgi:hypothetical protein
MSWNIDFIGNPENVVKALQENSAKLDGASKVEYDAVVPHLIGLVSQNFNSNKAVGIVVKVTASGHGYISTDGTDQYRQCSASVEQLYGVLV